ncbi:hypothetical protein [Paracidobacterium acidisoli]|uniref:Carboxypeptidase regulatory-like domain-containing protein n=1 Tax=Paracidobacterium acidisoli TaxID=2303751 RepID=A0A372IS00_9BACT|nr:hypothetical protein [Paracidobacterium acidisoli]MBT9330433.1 hypothetical protein [Paracidobacterium acidisoli]
MSEDSSGNAVGKWVAGVLATVVAAVLVWAITTFLPGWLNSRNAGSSSTQASAQTSTGSNSTSGTSSAPSGDPAKDIEVDGIVIDGITNKVLGGASVTLTVGGGSQQNVTTSFGSYSFLVKGADPSALAQLAVAVSGYRNVTDQAVVGQWGIRESVMIPLQVAEAPAAGPAPPGNLTGAVVAQGAHHEPLRIAKDRFVRPAETRVLTTRPDNRH